MADFHTGVGRLVDGPTAFDYLIIDGMSRFAPNVPPDEAVTRLGFMKGGSFVLMEREGGQVFFKPSWLTKITGASVATCGWRDRSPVVGVVGLLSLDGSDFVLEEDLGQTGYEIEYVLTQPKRIGALPVAAHLSLLKPWRRDWHPPLGNTPSGYLLSSTHNHTVTTLTAVERDCLYAGMANALQSLRLE